MLDPVLGNYTPNRKPVSKAERRPPPPIKLSNRRAVAISVVLGIGAGILAYSWALHQ